MQAQSQQRMSEKDKILRYKRSNPNAANFTEHSVSSHNGAMPFKPAQS